MGISPQSVKSAQSRPSSQVARARALQPDEDSMNAGQVTGHRAKEKRPRFTPRGTFKRKQILDAAAKVLARRGYAGTQMSEIAEEAGTRSGSLYYHFESREELIEEVLRQGVTQSFARARAVVDTLRADTSALDRLAAALRAHLKFQLVESDYARAAVRSIGQYPQDMWARVNAKFRAYGKFFDGLIVAAIQAGQIKPEVDRSALRMLILGAANWAPEWYRNDGPSSVEEIADLLVRLVFRGVGTAGMGRIEDQDATTRSKRAMRHGPARTTPATRTAGG
jgi:AcrR family transcriptional regulator